MQNAKISKFKNYLTKFTKVKENPTFIVNLSHLSEHKFRYNSGPFVLAVMELN